MNRERAVSDDPSAAQSAAVDDAADAEEEEYYEDEPSAWTDAKEWLLDYGAWYGVSTVVHATAVVIAVLLLGDAVSRPRPSEVPTFDTALDRPVVERMQIDLTPSLSRQIMPQTAVNQVASIGGGVATVGGGSGISGAVSVAVGRAPKLGGTYTASGAGPGLGGAHIDVGTMNVFGQGGSGLVGAVPGGTLGEALMATGGYAGAMDFLTQEILNRLVRSKVMVVWIFDQSLSMKDDQKEIRDRIEKVYTELGLSSALEHDALLTAVVSYGSGYAVHTPRPTSVMDEIRAAIDAVPVDESGEEMTCSAVGQNVGTFRSFTAGGGPWKMLIVLVSDESGNPNDNVRSLEPAIAVCKDAKASVYVLGREAVFGYPFAHMNWNVTVPAVGGGTVSRNFVVAIDRGPETAFVEMLQTEGFQRRRDAHPSGFGPYEQVRMARETGGAFLMLPTPEASVFRRDTTVFDYESMRPYLPDLRSRDTYTSERDSYHPLRAIIWKVINDLNPYKPEIARHIDLRQSFSADPGARASQIDQELAKAKQYVMYLDAAEKAMRDAREHRNREKEPRWRAHYDLMLAQLVAYKARVYEYGTYLTLFKSQPKASDPPAPTRVLTRWDLRDRRQTLSDKTKPMIDDATLMFQQAIYEYKNSPWATRAQYELSRGFGVDLVPVYIDPTPNPNPRRPVRPITTPKI